MYENIPSGGYRFYSLTQIRRMKPGAVFWHWDLGKGILLRDSRTRIKYVLWKKNGRYCKTFLVCGEHPWDQEIKVLHATTSEGYAGLIEKQLGIRSNYQLGF